jgi:RNA polymerase sigma factor (sigma-70 family)
MQKMTDSEMIKGCIKGNPKAQESLYKRFASKMLGVCMRYMNSREEAEDVMQDAFVKVFSNLQSLENPNALEAWMRRIMVNTSLNALRSNQIESQHLDVDDMEELIPDERFDEDSFAVEDLLRMVRELPAGYRAVFNLFEIEGYSHQEIADMLEVSVNTSKSQLLKARRQLQRKLANN